jgi:DNA-binding response OmpR family regulator
MRAIVQEYLTGEGYSVRTARDSSMFNRSRRPRLGDMLITAISLEPFNGFEIIEKVKSYDKYLPIIVLSGADEPSNRIRGLELGANDYVIKPFHLGELAARVSSIFRTLGKTEFDTPVKSLERLYLVSDRIESVANSIEALRINSLAGHVDGLRGLSEEIKISIGRRAQTGRSPPKSEVRAQAGRALPILAHIYNILGTERGAQTIISGAVAGIVSIGGWPAVTVYGLSMAAWMGKDAFATALRNLSGRNQ